MINLKSYVVMKEELDADNIQWKFNNWSKGVESSVLDAFMLDASYQKDIDGFKKETLEASKQIREHLIKFK